MFHLGPDVTLIWKKNHRCSHPIKEWQRKEQQFFLYNSRCLFHFLAMLGLQHSTALQYFIGMALPWFWNWKLLIFLAWVLRCCSKLIHQMCQILAIMWRRREWETKLQFSSFAAFLTNFVVEEKHGEERSNNFCTFNMPNLLLPMQSSDWIC